MEYYQHSNPLLNLHPVYRPTKDLWKASVYGVTEYLFPRQSWREMIIYCAERIQTPKAKIPINFPSPLSKC